MVLLMCCSMSVCSGRLGHCAQISNLTMRTITCGNIQSNSRPLADCHKSIPPHPPARLMRTVMKIYTALWSHTAAEPRIAVCSCGVMMRPQRPRLTTTKSTKPSTVALLLLNSFETNETFPQEHQTFTTALNVLRTKLHTN